MKLRLLAVLSLLGLSAAGIAAGETPAIFPFEPAQLLGVLPPAPPEWKVLRSEADSSLGEWLETRATRTYQEPPLPASAADPAPNAPGEIEISVLDTAGFAPALAAFANFTPARVGNVEKKLIGALPAIAVANENERQFIQVLVSGRYVVELTLTRLPRQRAEDWLRTFRFNQLPPASNTPASRPREFRLTHIDELQPKRNRSYSVSTTSATRVEAFLKTLPPSPPEQSTAEAQPKD